MAQAPQRSPQSVIGFDPQRNISVMSIERDLLRGVSLDTTLRGFGKNWRTLPANRPSEERIASWKKSREVSRIDVFLSQSWSADGWHKYFSLLLLFHWKTVALVQTLATVIFIVLDINELLPISNSTTREYFGEKVTRPVSAWAPIPALLGYATLCLVPEIGDWPQNPIVFFDAMCINQEDEVAKTRGIYSLTGVLANSEQLLVLWTPCYFTRCWCVCEVAAFASLRGANSVRWCPLFIQIFTVLVHVVVTAWDILDISLYLAGLSISSRQTVMFLCISIPLFFVIRLGRIFCSDRHKLRGQLEEWEFSQAQCREDSDRQLIRISIEGWFGDMSAFEDFVRGELKENAVRSLDGFTVSPGNLMFVASARMGNIGQWATAFARSGLSLEGVVSWIAGMWTETVCGFLVVVSMITNACEFFSKPLSNKVNNELLNILLVFLIQGFIVAFNIIVREIIDNVRFASFFLAALWSGAVICIFWPRA